MVSLKKGKFSRLTDVRFTKGGFPLLGNFYLRK